MRMLREITVLPAKTRGDDSSNHLEILSLKCSKFAPHGIFLQVLNFKYLNVEMKLNIFSLSLAFTRGQTK